MTMSEFRSVMLKNMFSSQEGFRSLLTTEVDLLTFSTRTWATRRVTPRGRWMPHECSRSRRGRGRGCLRSSFDAAPATLTSVSSLFPAACRCPRHTILAPHPQPACSDTPRHASTCSACVSSAPRRDSNDFAASSLDPESIVHSTKTWHALLFPPDGAILSQPSPGASSERRLRALPSIPPCSPHMPNHVDVLLGKMLDQRGAPTTQYTSALPLPPPSNFCAWRSLAFLCHAWCALVSDDVPNALKRHLRGTVSFQRKNQREKGTRGQTHLTTTWQSPSFSRCLTFGAPAPRSSKADGANTARWSETRDANTLIRCKHARTRANNSGHVRRCSVGSWGKGHTPSSLRTLRSASLTPSLSACLSCGGATD